MTTKTKAPKKAPVTITAPKIANAWIAISDIAKGNDESLIKGMDALVVELRTSQLSGTDIEKVIEATGKDAGLLKVSHVEGLVTWSDLRKDKAKGKAFKAMPLDKQLSTAVASYKLLGVGNAQALPTVEAILKANKDARKAKVTAKAKPAPTKASKASTRDNLLTMTAFINALDLEGFDDATHDAFAELLITIESKADAFNEVAIA